MSDSEAGGETRLSGCKIKQRQNQFYTVNVVWLQLRKDRVARQSQLASG